jgi:hypothetical protein
MQLAEQLVRSWFHRPHGYSDDIVSHPNDRVHLPGRLQGT